MICPDCKKQMHQFKGIGGGIAEEEKYKTWEVKECSDCKRLVKESYEVKVISRSRAERLKEEMEEEIVVD